MRIVKPFSLRDYFPSREEEHDLFGQSRFRTLLGKFFYQRRAYFNRLSFAILLLVSGLMVAPWHREGVILSLTLALFLVTLYLRTRVITDGLHIQRKVPDAAPERHEIQVELEIRNASSFAVSDLCIRDYFTGSTVSERVVVMTETVAPLSVHRLHYRVKCDAGMGMHRFGPLILLVADPLGIFQFTVTETDPMWIEVLPEALPIEEFRSPPSLESFSFGQNPNPLAGHSVTFLGVREYRAGDPLRKINWKLSLKHRMLIVNEFENSVSTDLTVCLDLDERSHIGRKAASSWERCKDIAISLLHDRLSEASRIQLHTQGLSVPFGAGSAHREALIQKVSKLKPTHATRPLLETAFASAPYGSSLLYIGPVYQDNADTFGTYLQLMAHKSLRITCIFVESRHFVLNLPTHPLVSGHVEAMNKKAGALLERLIHRNFQLGIRTYVDQAGQLRVRS
jgi:uncharacterized protein (DUF58 family)